jgi:hypothetical protein
MAAASLLTFPYQYSVYPHLDGLNIGPHRRTTRSCAAPGPLFHTWSRTPEAAGATDLMGGARYRTPDP